MLTLKEVKLSSGPAVSLFDFMNTNGSGPCADEGRPAKETTVSKC